LIEHVKNLLASSDKIIGIGSPRASVESNYALQKITGEENFFKGTTGTETNLLQHVLQLMHSGNIDLPSQKQIEQADAIIIVRILPTVHLCLLWLLGRLCINSSTKRRAQHNPGMARCRSKKYVQKTKAYVC
jgi:hypothetical protein